jgi:hypothetical protein
MGDERNLATLPGEGRRPIGQDASPLEVSHERCGGRCPKHSLCVVSVFAERDGFLEQWRASGVSLAERAESGEEAQQERLVLILSNRQLRRGARDIAHALGLARE